MATRILLSFKDTKIDKKLLDFLLKQSEVIGKGAYIKQLIQKELNNIKSEIEPK